MTAELKALIEYRLEQARDAGRAGEALLNEGLWRDAVNRTYYAEFYAVLALLITKGLGTSKHTGAISLFDREFVKKGAFSKELSRNLHGSFDMRQEADYEEMASIGEDEARLCAERSKEFVASVSEYLRGELSTGS